jgi:hypothetical protein
MFRDNYGWILRATASGVVSQQYLVDPGSWSNPACAEVLVRLYLQPCAFRIGTERDFKSLTSILGHWK